MKKHENTNKHIPLYYAGSIGNKACIAVISFVSHFSDTFLNQLPVMGSIY